MGDWEINTTCTITYQWAVAPDAFHLSMVFGAWHVLSSDSQQSTYNQIAIGFIVTVIPIIVGGDYFKVSSGMESKPNLMRILKIILTLQKLNNTKCHRSIDINILIIYLFNGKKLAHNSCFGKINVSWKSCCKNSFSKCKCISEIKHLQVNSNGGVGKHEKKSQEEWWNDNDN